MSLSLVGERTLLYRHHCRCGGTDGQSASGTWEEREEETKLRPGDVYLSSPAFFRHAVRKALGAEAVAVQLRIALSVEHEKWLDGAREGAGSTELTAAAEVMEAFQRPGWRLPSLHEVLTVEREYKMACRTEPAQL